DEVLSFRLNVTANDQNAANAGTGDFPLEIRLGSDSLAIDNRFTLLPPMRRPVRVGITGVPGDTKQPIQKALESSGLAKIVDPNTEEADMVFCGSGYEYSPPGSGSGVTEETVSSSHTGSATPPWLVRVCSESDTDKIQSFVGPFVVNRSTPLTTGISLDGVVWSGSESAPMGGLPLVSAGNVHLFTEQIRKDTGKDFRIQLNERVSTLTLSPAWPILVWNILKDRSDQLYGVPHNNLRLGAEAQFIPAPGDDTITVLSPSGESRTITVPIRAGKVAIPAELCGIYEVKANSGTYPFSVGTLSNDESNLQKNSGGKFGSWLDEDTIRTDYRKIAWILLLAALAIFVLHTILSYKKTAVATKS
ncbi:MAG: hypothetical protein ACRC2T_19320, partial [Thermoguttaceae bacterium]